MQVIFESRNALSPENHKIGELWGPGHPAMARIPNSGNVHAPEDLRASGIQVSGTTAQVQRN